MDQDSTILISDQRLQQEIENGMDNWSLKIEEYE